MAEYKGIYYQDDSKQRYFEGGAHFKYIHLYKALQKLSSSQKEKLKREQLRKKREIKKKEKNLKSNLPISKKTNKVSTLIYNIILYRKQKIKLIIN